MSEYTVRFDRGNRGWTCSVFPLGADGSVAGPAVVSGTGTTRDTAKEMSLALAHDPGVRAALASADHTRPYWVQGPFGEKLEAQRRSASGQATPRRTRPSRP